jgi:hypothetical protein
MTFMFKGVENRCGKTGLPGHPGNPVKQSNAFKEDICSKFINRIF